MKKVRNSPRDDFKGQCAIFDVPPLCSQERQKLRKTNLDEKAERKAITREALHSASVATVAAL